MHLSDNEKKIIIYYNASDIFLGIALLALVIFFIHDYLSHSLNPQNINGVYMNEIYRNQSGINYPMMKP